MTIHVGDPFPARVAAYRRHLHLPFDVVPDTDRTLYRLLGAERGSNRQVWSAGTIRMYARLLRSLRYVSLPSTPDARPPISELSAALDWGPAGCA